MSVGGGGVSALFWVPPATAGTNAGWLEPGVLTVGTAGGGGTSIGGTVTGGTDTAVLFIHPNAVLAQDVANFSWDDTNFNLSIQASGGGQGIFQVGGKNALFRVPNALGDNWFEGEAGNLTTTGFNNFGTGTGCLFSITTGNGNTGIGASVMLLTTTGSSNLGIGTSALHSAVSPNNNVAIGNQCGQNLGGSSNQNTFIGDTAGAGITTGNSCTIIGRWIGPSPSAPESNIIGLADGSSPTSPQLDWNYTLGNIWSMQKSTTAQGLNVYNTTDNGHPPTNYERFCFDWTITSNVARIAMQSGGTGSQRIIAIDGFQKAGAPVAGDLPTSTWGLIHDTVGAATWLCYNDAGAIRKVQLV